MRPVSTSSNDSSSEQGEDGPEERQKVAGRQGVGLEKNRAVTGMP